MDKIAVFLSGVVLGIAICIVIDLTSKDDDYYDWDSDFYPYK